MAYVHEMLARKTHLKLPRQTMQTKQTNQPHLNYRLTRLSAGSCLPCLLSQLAKHAMASDCTLRCANCSPIFCPSMFPTNHVQSVQQFCSTQHNILPLSSRPQQSCASKRKPNFVDGHVQKRPRPYSWSELRAVLLFAQLDITALILQLIHLHVYPSSLSDTFDGWIQLPR